MTTQSIPDQLASARETIIGSLKNQEVLDAVRPRGYDKPEFEHAQHLLKTADQAVSIAGNATGAAVNATEVATASFDDLKAALGTLRELARPALANDHGDLTLLGLTGRMPRTPSACATMLSTAHSGLASEARIAERLTLRGYGPSAIAADAAIIARSQAAETDQTVTATAVRTAVQAQTAALAALNAWLKEYRAIARVALKARPDLQPLIAGR